jgi:1,2-phenylacetyl-CoA epoxidase catalytic subunit
MGSYCPTKKNRIMNIEDKALDIILDHTSSSEWEDVCELTWNTDEVQELLIKALNQGRSLPIDSVVKPSYCADESYHKIDRCKNQCGGCKEIQSCFK